MSRSGYSDDCENLELYRANVDRAINGKRGQAFLKEMAETMDAMPEKRLIAGDLVRPDGECCAIGTVFKKRQTDMSKVEPDWPSSVAKAAGVSTALAAEIEWVNDDDELYYSWNRQESRCETPEERWIRVRKWIDGNLCAAVGKE